MCAWEKLPTRATIYNAIEFLIRTEQHSPLPFPFLQNVKFRLLGEADGAVKMDAVNEDVAFGRDDAGETEGVDSSGKVRPVDD